MYHVVWVGERCSVWYERRSKGDIVTSGSCGEAGVREVSAVGEEV